MIFRDFVKQIPEDNDDQTDTPARPARAATPEGFEPDEQVNVIISMVADPERRLLGHSEKAIQRYEKTRTLLINRVSNIYTYQVPRILTTFSEIHSHE